MSNPHDQAWVGSDQPAGQPWRRPRWWFRPAARGWCSDGEEVFVVAGPAEGGAFDFDLSVSCHWLRQRSLEPSSYEAQAARMDLRRQLESELREIARRHPPDALADAEHEMNEAPAGHRVFAAGRLVCQVQVRVGPGSDLRSSLQSQWREARKAEQAYQAQLRRIEQATELRERWLTFLHEFPEDPLALVAMRLADDFARVAEIVREARVTDSRVEKQEAETREKIRQLVQEAQEQHKQLDLYDFVTRSDSALQELLEVVKAEQNGRPSAAAGAAAER